MDEILEAYPGCTEAIRCCEQPSAAGMWETMAKDRVPPEVCIQLWKIAGEVFVKVLHENGAIENAIELAARLSVEFDHPDFLRYVMEKLGAS